MVYSGKFSLLELRKLYIDELLSYYTELSYILEQAGVIKEGSYDKMISSNDASATVNSLRKQLFKNITGQGVKK